MKSILTKRIVAVAAGLFLSWSVVAQDQARVEYSADTLIETASNSMKGRIYSAPGKERRDMMQGADAMTAITRHDKKVMWSLMPQMKMYMEVPLTAGDAQASPEDLSGYKMEFTEVGPEQWNGIATTKSKIMMTGKDTRMGGFAWKTKEGVMVKLDAIAINKNDKTRFKMELSNLKIGKQDAALFEIPPGYKPMSIPGMSPDALKKMMQR